MNFFSRLIKHLNELHLFTALCITAFYWFQVLSLKKEVSFSYSLILFFGSVIIYNLHGPLKLSDIKNNLGKSLTLFVATAGLTKGLSDISFHEVLYLAPAVIISLLYILPVFSGKKRLRDFGFIKIFILSCTLTYLTVFVPLCLKGVHPEVLWKVVFSRFIFLFLVGILFDIRDTVSDKQAGLRSIPILLGEKRTKSLLMFILSFAGITDFYLTYQFIIELPSFLSLAFSQFILFVFILFSYRLQNKQYYSVAADAILALPLLILWFIG